MNDYIDFYMEPIRFLKNPDFLSGVNVASLKQEVITDKNHALDLLFSQELPSDYLVWDDFFSSLTSDIILNGNYKPAQDTITKQIRAESADSLKEAMRKRKAFLIRKKNGLFDNREYDIFLNEVSDECNYILMMVSIQRLLRKEVVENKLEELFSIFKAGGLPCGVKKQNSEIVFFNPATLKKKTNGNVV